MLTNCITVDKNINEIIHIKKIELSENIKK